jgi:Tfp pilus assembly protein FimT
MTPNGAQGFVLLEVLVAFVIAVLAVALMIGATSDALRGGETAALYQQATMRAQSRLSAVADAGPPRPGEREGDDGGGFRWHEHVAVLRTDAGRAPNDAAAPMALYGIGVWITWQDGISTRTVRLETQRVAPAP